MLDLKPAPSPESARCAEIRARVPSTSLREPQRVETWAQWAAPVAYQSATMLSGLEAGMPSRVGY